ncbi:conserved hypothetical protein [Arcobacter nitrofigilis DSM 7299]|uniref:Uncharacterized protein n=1 Tax=Arcobacter nitrofigilis (strain ATCC 33309 / DSM 7299 / CCUG 15893 / LMG 7604 / NCTC 12251 / CI) TaxID=572480 RepID=D5V393_ARCNC|nr:hypothetical protein [Arcobacter nitrofigilis]ADG92675.1 conserved hypothetical protein [Arcobacter nitrofigilis DSM 7299]
MKTMFVLLIFISLIFIFKLNVKTDEKLLKSKEDVNLIFSSVYKSNLKAYKNKL